MALPHSKAIFAQYHPPFDLTSDLLLALCFAPTPPLRKAFPHIPFLSLFNRTPLLLWFSRVRQIWYTNTEGQRVKMGESDATLYYELNVAALLAARAFFVPAIYATSDLTIAIGHAYGMPKQSAGITLEQTQADFASEVKTEHGMSVVQARALGNATLLRWALAKILPQWIWKAHFPSGETIRPLIQAIPHARWYHIRSGRLDLQVEWLPKGIPLVPLGLFLPQQKMQLPTPPDLPPLEESSATR